MGASESIWAIAKWRYLQSEARLWIISNKALEIIFLIGASAWIYFEFFAHSYGFMKYLGLLLSVLSLLEIRSRRASYVGYFDGYDQGFADAATRNCDYWGNTHDEQSEEREKLAVLDEISRCEANVTEENMKSRNEEVREGFSRLTGFFLTWKKIK